MVKKLYLVRHAEAAHNTSDDFSRPLTPEGERVARHLGKWLDSHEINVDQLMCSTALRAKTTAELIDESLGKGSIALEPELYEASVRTFLRAINQISEEYNEVLVVAHNPAITYLAEYVSGQPLSNMEPGGIAILSFEKLAWEEVSEKNGYLVKYVSPGEIS